MSIFLEVAANAARDAGQFLKEHFNRAAEIHYKDAGHSNPASTADEGAENIILKALSSRFPDHAFLAEERGASERKSEFTWVIDPLDGTVNFIHGYPHFAVSIALDRGGDVVVGVIFDPLTGEMFTAEKGAGAFLDRRPLRVSRTDRLAESLLCVSFPYERDSRQFNEVVSLFICLASSSQAVRRSGSTALALANVACGRCDGFCVAGNQPWDYAAGTLLVAEAGGRVTDFKGRPFQISSGEVLATNGLIHDQVWACLSGRDSF